jgi:hypothetical protein
MIHAKIREKRGLTARAGAANKQGGGNKHVKKDMGKQLRENFNNNNVNNRFGSSNMSNQDKKNQKKGSEGGGVMKDDFDWDADPLEGLQDSAKKQTNPTALERDGVPLNEIDAMETPRVGANRNQNAHHNQKSGTNNENIDNSISVNGSNWEQAAAEIVKMKHSVDNSSENDIGNPESDVDNVPLFPPVGSQGITGSTPVNFGSLTSVNRMLQKQMGGSGQTPMGAGGMGMMRGMTPMSGMTPMMGSGSNRSMGSGMTPMGSGMTPMMGSGAFGGGGFGADEFGNGEFGGNGGFGDFGGGNEFHDENMDQTGGNFNASTGKKAMRKGGMRKAK